MLASGPPARRPRIASSDLAGPNPALRHSLIAPMSYCPDQRDGIWDAGLAKLVPALNHFVYPRPRRSMAPKRKLLSDGPTGSPPGSLYAATQRADELLIETYAICSLRANRLRYFTSLTDRGPPRHCLPTSSPRRSMRPHHRAQSSGLRGRRRQLHRRQSVAERLPCSTSPPRPARPTASTISAPARIEDSWP